MKFVIAIILLTSASWVYGADIKRTDSIPSHINPDGAFVYLNGPIEEGDFDRLMDLVLLHRFHVNGLYINTPGGDVVEAMRIGRFARDYLLPVTVVQECLSACFLVLAGAVTRGTFFDLDQPIGLHRPYYDRKYFSGLTSQQAEEKYRKLDQDVRGYLDMMDIPRDLADDIFRTSSDQLLYINSKTLIQRIGEHSPSYYEWTTAKCGTMTKEEKRDVRAAKFLALYTDNRDDLDEEYSRFYYEMARPALTLSKGYRDYLINKEIEIKKCLGPILGQERDAVLEKYLGTVNPDRNPFMDLPMRKTE